MFDWLVGLSVNHGLVRLCKSLLSLIDGVKDESNTFCPQTCWIRQLATNESRVIMRHDDEGWCWQPSPWTTNTGVWRETRTTQPIVGETVWWPRVGRYGAPFKFDVCNNKNRRGLSPHMYYGPSSSTHQKQFTTVPRVNIGNTEQTSKNLKMVIQNLKGV